MKQLTVAIIFVLSAMLANAGVNDDKNKASDNKSEATVLISGSVADENSGESLVGVEVKLEGTNLKTYTDFDGKFTFENIKPGEYKLSTNYISYRKQSTTFNTSEENRTLKIKLQASK